MKIFALVRAAAAVVVLLLLAVGIPIALAKLGGNPLPHHVPTLAEIWRLLLSRDDGSLFIRVFTLVGWVAWASFALGLIAELPTLFGIRAWHLPGLSAQQHIAGLLLAAIISSSAAGTAFLTKPAPHHSATPSVGRHPVAVAAAPATISPSPAPSVDGHPAAPTVLTSPHPRPTVLTPGSYIEHTVTRTDSLLDLAERFYGDPLQFQKILDATYGLPQPDGKTLHKGQTFLYPGWTVRIPTPQRPASSSGEAKPSPSLGAGRQQANPVVYQVAHDDYLWFIAQRFLGDPHAYPAIAALNPGLIPDTAGPHGPDHIQPGWRLTLPANAYDRGLRPHATGHVLPPRPEPAPSPNPADTPEPQPPTGPSPTSAATPAPSTSGSIAPAIPGSTPPAVEATSTADGQATPAATPGSSPHTSHTPSPRADGASTASPQQNGVGGQVPAAESGIRLRSSAWISTGLVVLIGTIGLLRRLHLRRSRGMRFPIPPFTGPAPSPVPESLYAADVAGQDLLADATNTDLPGQMKAAPSQSAPIGIDQTGEHVSLLRYAGIAIDGPGASAAIRGLLAGALCTGMLELMFDRFVTVTTTDLMARLLPPDVTPSGLDPHGETFDGERLFLHDSVDEALAHVERQAIRRRCVLDNTTLTTVAESIAANDIDEHVIPWLLLLPAEAGGHLADRLTHLVDQSEALNLRLALLGRSPIVASVTVDHDGLVIDDDGDVAGIARMSTLSAQDLADLLALLSQTASRPVDNLGRDQVVDPEPPLDGEQPPPALPVRDGGRRAVVRLQVLGPVTAHTDAGRIDSGIPGTSAALLAVLAAHPQGRTVTDLAATLHPDDGDDAEAKIRTAVARVQNALRAATGRTSTDFIINNHVERTYRLDSDLFDVDLWNMLIAIDAANRAEDDRTCLAALREAVEHYHGGFASDQPQARLTDYANELRYQYLCAMSRIAEIVEPDQPDHAIAALERAIEEDPVNEELYQRLIRVQSGSGRPGDVRRMLTLLDSRLFEVGQSEMSAATRHLAVRPSSNSLDGETMSWHGGSA